MQPCTRPIIEKEKSEHKKYPKIIISRKKGELGEEEGGINKIHCASPKGKKKRGIRERRLAETESRQRSEIKWGGGRASQGRERKEAEILKKKIRVGKKRRVHHQLIKGEKTKIKKGPRKDVTVRGTDFRRRRGGEWGGGLLEESLFRKKGNRGEEGEKGGQ